jgi:hypothetical protein
MKMSFFRWLSGITLLVVLPFVASAQEPAKATTETAAAANQKNQKTTGAETVPIGTIKGQLVASDGQPFTNANVMVQSLTGGPNVKPTRADADGKFAFEDLPAGSYLVIATAPGYIDESTALRDYTQWPRHLIGSTVKLNMVRGGVITGMVTNAKGEPVVGVPVRATLASQVPTSMIGVITGSNATETDDRGVYRIFGLLPGQYVVDAGGTGRFGQFTPNGFDTDVPTFYPSTTRDTAVPVSVRSGDETVGIDIKYRGVEGRTISGVIVGDIQANPQTGGAITVFLTHSGSSSVLTVKIVGLNDTKRAFGFNGVADGEYDLVASYYTSPRGNALITSKHVTVRNTDITGLELGLVCPPLMRKANLRFAIWTLIVIA